MSWSDLLRAVEEDNIDYVEALLKHDVSLIKQDTECLFDKVISVQMLKIFLLQAYKEIIDFCIEGGFSVLTHSIAFKKNIAIIKEIVACGRDINVLDGRGYTPLMQSILSRRDLNFIEEILKMGVDVNKCGCDRLSPLHLANEREVVSLLIKYGACVNARDNYGRTPLMQPLIAQRRDIRAVYELINGGAGIKEIDSYGNTLLHYANSAELAYVFVKCGAPVNIKNSLGQTPLMFAILLQKNVDVIKSLVECGEDVNCVDDNLNTPLHFDCTDEVVNLLVWYGANLNMRNRFNETPLQTNLLCLYSFKIPKALIKHSLLTSKCEISTENINIRISNDYIEKCKIELNRMKTMNIKINLSFYSFCVNECKHNKVISNSCGKVLYSNNQIKEMFPLFYDVIVMKMKSEKCKQFLLGNLDRLSLRSKTETFLNDIQKLPFNSNIQSCSFFKSIELNYDCLYCIVKYFNHRQLLNLFLASF
ncbi:uncharacterized protein LOC142323987 [Lycorma delicatula]|uniref:uncharacterized protein LOC142323987 n=1 Tax=Lycorma delicatula TaxID=130591 RepID=UPI003F51111C